MPEPLRGACLFGQSGGPTSVINASAAGVFDEALKHTSHITHVLGAAYGVRGILNECFYDISKEDPKELELLKHTPSSALGSVRYRLTKEEDLRRVLEVFKRYNIRYFFYNGGNDSMDTCNKISKFLLRHNYACRVMGIPKTIDNDLMGTDHCPGYGSAAKFVASSIMSMHLDATVYAQGQVTVVEIMGRDAGWLTAASSLACSKGLGPDLILLPEVVFDKDAFLRGVGEEIARNNGSCFIAVSEGIRFADGKLVAAQPALSHDTFGHPRLGGVAGILQQYIQEKFPKSKCKSVELNILQRCCASMASSTDVEEAFQAGSFAVKRACEGETDYMVSIQRGKVGDAYRATFALSRVDAAANSVKQIPAAWIRPHYKGLTEDFYRYASPLIQGDAHPPQEDGLPRYAKLKKVKFTLRGSSL